MIAPDSEIGGVEDDSSLVKRIQQGDRAAETQLIERYAGGVFAMAMVRLRDRESARELVDDVMMAVVSAIRRGSVHDTSRLGAFIHGTALNLVHNCQRARCRMPRTVAIDEDLAAADMVESCEQDSDVQALRKCIQGLTPQDRQVLFMSLNAGLKPAEIAALLGLSPGLVRQQKSRALKRLREMLNGASPTGLR